MNYQDFINALSSPKLRFNEPLAKHTYFKIGGPAHLFYPATSYQELVKVIRLAQQFHIPYFLIGGGSNILVTDNGFPGLVIKNQVVKIRLKSLAGKTQKGNLSLSHVFISATSGTPANMLIRYSLDQGLAGLEDFLGLPGTVGGAIYNNSHHLGKFIGDLIWEVEVLTPKGEIKKYSHQQMDFAYDYSLIQKTNDVILQATFRLSIGSKKQLWQRAEQALQRRAQTQPLGLPSSGCIFKNISLATAIKLSTPNHTCSAGYLIDRAGLKNLRIGDACVSDKHANFIVNLGHASARDVIQLMNKIRASVKKKFAVDLQPEIFIVGQSKN